MAGEPSPRPKKHWWDVYHPPLSPAERQEAIEDPGPSWTQYFYRDFIRWWVILGFLVVDALIITSFVHPLLLAAMIPGLVLATYLQFLGYQYLWHRPKLDEEWRRGPFRPRWYRPVRFGRWTVEGDLVRSGIDPAPATGPDPREFL